MKPNKTKIKKDNYKFDAEVHEGGSGYYTLSKIDYKYYGDKKYHQTYCREHGNVDDWLDDAKNMLDEASLLYDFLDDLRYQHASK